jgi:hypothetical protein
MITTDSETVQTAEIARGLLHEQLSQFSFTELNKGSAVLYLVSGEYMVSSSSSESYRFC